MAGKRKPPVIATGGGQAQTRRPGNPAEAGPASPRTEPPAAQSTRLPEPNRTPEPKRAEAPRKVSVAPIPGGEAKRPEAKPAQAKVLAFPDSKQRQRKQQAAGGGRRWRLWAVLGGFAVVLALLMLAVMFSPLLALKTITVDGTKLASSDQVQAALAPLKGKPLTQIDQGQVQQLLTGLVQVQSVSVEARPPSTLLVHVVERIPVAVLKNGEQFILVDPQGTQLGTVADPAAAKLPLIDGGTAAIGQATFSSITAVLAALPEEVRAQMQSAAASSPNAVELTLLDGKKVVWGDASQMALKAKVLQTLLNNPPVAQPGKPAPAPINTYDVSTPKYPVTR